MTLGDKFILLTFISLAGLIASLALIAVRYKNRSYHIPIWNLIYTVCWAICYVAGLAGLYLTYY